MNRIFGVACRHSLVACAALSLSLGMAQPSWAGGGAGGSDPSGSMGGSGGTFAHPDGERGVPVPDGGGGGGGGGIDSLTGNGGAGGKGESGAGGVGGLASTTGWPGGDGGAGTTYGGGGGGGGAGTVVGSSVINYVIYTGGAGGDGATGRLGGGGGGGQGGSGALLSVTGTGSSSGGSTGYIINHADLTGGNGGAGGGIVSGRDGDGGNGGDGGAGILVTNHGLLWNKGSIAGGQGGSGGATGSTVGSAGAGGAGGVGVLYLGAGTRNVVDNSAGTIIGGKGGSADPTNGGVVGAGGVGISGDMLMIDNKNGTISGGLSGDGATRANAIEFTGGASSLDLTENSVINGGMKLGSTATLTINQTGNLVYDGAIDGSGTLLKAGGGRLALTGTNTYSGGTTIQDGLLAGNSISLQGNITNNAALEFNQVANGAFNDVISGAGSLTKTGTGTLILNGANTYTGGTVVGAGTLEVGDAAHESASILGDVDVNAGATLRGHGTIGTTTSTITNSGIVRPGGSIGILIIPGNYTQSSTGTLMIDVSPTVASQLKVAGTATLNGTLSLLYGPGTYTTRTYTIVDAGTVSGKFTKITDNKPKDVTGQTVTYTPTTVVLGITAGVIAPTNATIFGTAGAAALRDNQRVNGLLLDRLGSLCDACTGQRVWARATGTDTHIDGNSGAPDARDKRYGFLAGLDKYLSNGATAGLAVGYSHADVTEDSGDARAKLDTLRLAAYAGKRLGPVNVAGTLGYAYDFISTTRSFGSLGNAEDSGHGQIFTAGAQVSLPWALGRATLTPRIGLRYAHLDGFGLDESGPTSQNLNVDNQHADSLQPYATVTLDYPLNLAADKPANLQVRLGYAYETWDASHDVSVTSIDGTRFLIPSTTDSHGMLTAGLGLDIPVSKATNAYVRYDAVFHTGNVSAQSVQVGLSYRF